MMSAPLSFIWLDRVISVTVIVQVHEGVLDGVAHLPRRAWRSPGPARSRVRAPEASATSMACSSTSASRVSRAGEPQQHRGAGDRADGLANPLAGNVGRRAVTGS